MIFILSLIVITSGFFFYSNSLNKNEIKSSNYELYSKQTRLNEFNYSTDSIYKPIGVWMGRLIFPTKVKNDDSVGFEVYHTDKLHQDLVGKVVDLGWSQELEVQDYLKIVRKDVRFSSVAIESEKAGNLHPTRLNNKPNVGALQSLAGARPQDDVIVKLLSPQVSGTSLKISQEPIQITGTFYALVKIVKRVSPNKDEFLVDHFNSISQQFDGESEVIIIPKVSPDRNGVYRSTNQWIESSPSNLEGWYIYGMKDAKGVFMTQAIAPRQIFQLKPDSIYLGLRPGLNYINEENWKSTTEKKATSKTVLLDPTAKNQQDALSIWKEGDKAIVMHLFGGIGGKKAEPKQLGMVTGHFAYGIATVVRDAISNNLKFDINYQQVYAHNPDGIVAGTLEWESYMGDLQRGWLGDRPVSDILVKFDAVTEDYNFDGIELSPLAEFTRQLNIMTARYRIGDGTGAASVNPATSCVQDSNQALYVTIRRIEAAVASNPQIQEWLHRHPQDAQTQRFQKLVKLGRSLQRQLTPLGIIRSDWENNAQYLAGTRPPDNLIATVFAGITSWRTLLPRRAQDEIASLFLRNGAKLWIIRTNQIGGFDPNIEPLAPTAFFGHRNG